MPYRFLLLALRSNFKALRTTQRQSSFSLIGRVLARGLQAFDKKKAISDIRRYHFSNPQRLYAGCSSWIKLK